RNQIGDDEHAGLVRFFGIDPQVAHAARDHRADVAVGEAVGLERLFHRPAKLIPRERDLQADGLGAGVQALNVCLALEDLAVVNANSFEHAVAIEQAVVVDADLGVRLIDELAVEPDLEGLLCRRRLLRLGGGHRHLFALSRAYDSALSSFPSFSTSTRSAWR